jgi:hypothetical protein
MAWREIPSASISGIPRTAEISFAQLYTRKGLTDRLGASLPGDGRELPGVTAVGIMIQAENKAERIFGFGVTACPLGPFRKPSAPNNAVVWCSLHRPIYLMLRSYGKPDIHAL